jgi:hypothetical protein
MKPSAIACLPILCALAVAACSNADSDVGGDESNVTGGSRERVSGFDFDGPKVLPGQEGTCNFITQPEEEKACLDAGGKAKLAGGCETLCSTPIARSGKVAGYDFTGYQQAASTLAVCSFFTEPEESKACTALGGSSVHSDGCRVFCSTPIAPEGKVAGYDLEGFRILPNDSTIAELCAAVLSPVEKGCMEVGGKIRRANGCKVLCSLPI